MGQIELRFPVDGVEAEVSFYDSQGKKLEDVAVVVVQPYFFADQSAVDICRVFLKSGKNDVVGRSVLRLSRQTGKLKLRDRNSPTVWSPDDVPAVKTSISSTQSTAQK